MKHETLYKIEELLCRELDEYGHKEKLVGTGELQTLDTLLHATKNLYKVMDPVEKMDGGKDYSRRGSHPYYYDVHDEDSFRRGRDKMGRYTSRSGSDMIERLKAMRDETDDPHEKHEFDEFIKTFEH